MFQNPNFFETGFASVMTSSQMHDVFGYPRKIQKKKKETWNHLVEKSSSKKKVRGRYVLY